MTRRKARSKRPLFQSLSFQRDCGSSFFCTFVLFVSVNPMESHIGQCVCSAGALAIVVSLTASISIRLHGTDFNVYNFVFFKYLSSQICKCLGGSSLRLALSNVASIKSSVKYA